MSRLFPSLIMSEGPMAFTIAQQLVLTIFSSPYLSKKATHKKILWRFLPFLGNLCTYLAMLSVGFFFVAPERKAKDHKSLLGGPGQNRKVNTFSFACGGGMSPAQGFPTRRKRKMKCENRSKHARAHKHTHAKPMAFTAGVYRIGSSDYTPTNERAIQVHLGKGNQSQ